LHRANDIYDIAESLLENVDKRPVRLIGITLSGFTDTAFQQLSLFDSNSGAYPEKLDSAVMSLQRKYGIDIVKTAGELIAEMKTKPGSG
jgi:hypothetical protein